MDYVLSSGQKIKYSYAELADVLDVCRKPLADNGLAVMQPSRIDQGQAIVTTLLMHSSGEWISSEIAITCQGKRPQEEGSALTYARRYGIAAMLGLASEDDDDAQAAQDATKSRQGAVKQSEPAAQQAPIGPTKPVAASAPAQPMQQAQQAVQGPTTTQELVEQAMTQFGLPPSSVAKEAGRESTARIPLADIPRIWTQISSGKYPRKQPAK